MTRREAANYLRLSDRGFRRFLEQKLFPEISVGRKRLYRKSALDRALAKLETCEAA